MSDNSAIEWTDTTWGPTTGCDRVSAGCTNCYALTLAKRLKAMGSAKYQTDGDPRTSGPGFGLAMHPDSLGAPLHWRRPRRIFVNSMSDLFHAKVTDEFIGSVWNTMALTPQHTYQILTKRPGRMRSLLKRWEADDWHWRDHHMRWCGPIAGPLPNVWLGVSVEDQKWADVRIPLLLDTPAAVRFLSCEPLLGPVDLSRWLDTPPTCGCGAGPAGAPDAIGCCAGCMTPEPSGIDWVIGGGESGSGFRPLDLDWARSLRDQCVTAAVSYLFKQVGGRTPKAGGRELDGRTWDEYPGLAAAR
jgi:protein gp37